VKAARIALGVALIVAACVLAVRVGITALTDGSDVWWAAWFLGVSGAVLIYLTLLHSPERSKRS
jgi:cytosine/uracil/thiamine/allantoin permease